MADVMADAEEATRRMQERAQKRLQLQAQIRAAQFLQRRVRILRAKRARQALARAQQERDALVGSMVTGQFKGCGWGALIDLKSKKVLARSKCIEFLTSRRIHDQPCIHDYVYAGEEAKAPSVDPQSPHSSARVSTVPGTPRSTASVHSSWTAPSSSSGMKPDETDPLLSSVTSLRQLVLAEPRAGKQKAMPAGGWKLLVRGKLHCFHLVWFAPPEMRPHVTLRDPKQVRMASVAHAAVAAQASKKYIVLAGVDVESGGSVGDAALEVAHLCFMLDRRDELRTQRRALAAEANSTPSPKPVRLTPARYSSSGSVRGRASPLGGSTVASPMRRGESAASRAARLSPIAAPRTPVLSLRTESGVERVVSPLATAPVVRTQATAGGAVVTDTRSTEQALMDMARKMQTMARGQGWNRKSKRRAYGTATALD